MKRGRPKYVAYESKQLWETSSVAAPNQWGEGRKEGRYIQGRGNVAELDMPPTLVRVVVPACN